MRIDNALDRFLQQLDADGRSIHTINQYRRHVRLLARWAADVGHSGERDTKYLHQDDEETEQSREFPVLFPQYKHLATQLVGVEIEARGRHHFTLWRPQPATCS